MKHGAPLLVVILAGAALLAARPWPAEVWQAAASLSAWLGSALLVASLMLMIREPRLSSALGGLDTMYRWHHRCGTWGYMLVLLHPLALAAQAGLLSSQMAARTLSPFAQPWPVGLGWLSLLLMMAGLAVTFSPRVGYRRWRTVHLSLAAAVLAGLLHGLLLRSGSLALMLFLLLAVLAIAFRLIAADHGALAYPYRVTQASHPADGLIEATLEPLASELRIAPGQFVLVAFGNGPGFQGCEEFHPFTVSNLNERGVLTVTIKALGACTSHVQRLQAGTHVRVQGPFGNFLPSGETRAQLWIAGGIGITPFIARLRVSPPTVPISLIYLYRHLSDAAFAQELMLLKTSIPTLELVQVETGDTAPELDTLLARVSDLDRRDVRVCGPAPLVAGLRREFKRRNLPLQQIHFESFDFR